MGRLLGSSTSASVSLIMGAKLRGSGKQGQGAKSAPVKAAEPMRIAKAMAHAGLCSRRDAERWIGEGRVAVNGTVLKTPAHVVSPTDKITVDGKPLPKAEAPRLWRYNKPKGLVTSHKDPQGRKTVFEALPPELPRVVSVGRLDLNTEGLLLLTTDGELAQASRVAEHRLAQALSRAGAWQGDASRPRQARQGHDHRRGALRAGRGQDRSRAGKQCVAHARASRRQEPRGEAARRVARPHRQPADPHLLRPVRARRFAGRRR